MSELPYESIGAYRLQSLAGRGGFATVFVAVDDRLEDTVAVKLLADNHAVDPDVRARFVAEGRTLRRIDHPNLIRVHDVGETERGQPYLVLEYADRGDLASRVATLRDRGWQPSPDDVAAIAAAMLDAVTALHDNELLHRDLKPDNLLLRSTSAGSGGGTALVAADERIMVSDLGFAKDLALHSGLTVGGGSRGFSAPEQLAGGTVTKAADVYGAAQVLRWLLGPESVDEPRWCRQLRAVLEPAVAPDPQQRPTASELLDDVRRVTAAAPIPVANPALDRATASPNRRSARPLVAAAAAVAILVGAVAVTLWLMAGENATGSDGQVIVPFGEGELVVTGPPTIAVGAEALITATGPTGTRFDWRLPDGSRLADVSQIVVAPTSRGLAMVEVLATSTGGDSVTVPFRFDVD